MRHIQEQLAMVLLISATILGLSACDFSIQSKQEPIRSTSPRVEDIVVRKTQPQRAVVDAEDVPLPNCGGSGPLTQSLGSEASVRRGVTIRNARSVAGGAAIDIPEIAEVYLEAEVEVAYQDEYETANKRLDTVEMVAAARTHSIYEIAWEQISYDSAVAFTLNGDGVEADYSFVMNVPKVAGSRSEICPTDTPAAVPPSVVTSEVVTPSPFPTTETESAREIVTPQDVGQCELVGESFPQSIEAARNNFALPEGERNFRLIYEGCGAIATGFIFEGASEFELMVPNGGCIDSYSGAFFSEPPVEDSFGGLRAYGGLVRATGVTYRASGCNLKP